jgi:hypothetical protein
MLQNVALELESEVNHSFEMMPPPALFKRKGYRNRAGLLTAATVLDKDVFPPSGPEMVQCEDPPQYIQFW